MNYWVKRVAFLLIFILLLIFIGRYVLNWWNRGENITTAFLEAKSYFVEYDLFYSDSNDHILVREWYIKPNSYYQERSRNGEILLQVWSSEKGTIWRNINQSEELHVSQYVESTLWQAFKQLSDQPAFKNDEGFYLMVPKYNIPHIRLECNKKGVPQTMLFKNKAGQWNLVFREFNLNIKVDESIIAPFVT